MRATELDTILDSILDAMSSSMLDTILDAAFNTRLGIWGFRPARLDARLNSMLALTMGIGYVRGSKCL